MNSKFVILRSKNKLQSILDQDEVKERRKEKNKKEESSDDCKNEMKLRNGNFLFNVVSSFSDEITNNYFSNY